MLYTNSVRCFLKLLLILFLVSIDYRLATTDSHAASEFSATYENFYSVSPSGATTVKHNVILTNNISNIYADEYSLSIGLPNISKLEIKDTSGLITPKVSTTDSQTTINFNFPDKVVGKNKSNHFTISYQTPDIAVKQGTIWELNIPRLSSQEIISKQQTTINIPTAFGLPSYTTPSPKYTTNNGQNIQLYFDLSTSSQNISAIFGTSQYIDFELKYFLENTKPESQTKFIAIPPNTNYQDIYYTAIDPQPENITTDPDGNWIAQFLLAPNHQQTIFVKGVARINFTPSISPLSPHDYQRLLRDTAHWQVTNPDIASLATKLVTPKSIYQYLVEHLNYDYSKVYQGNTRLGAVAALAQPEHAICTEFTDLFIALSRAAGIPAREHNGYAFTQNALLRPLSLSQDILHAWPEFYDTSTNRWYQVDPTWGKTTGGVDYFTKLDLNHITFVIHGENSQAPLPAGSYRQKSSSDKTMLLTPTQPISFPEAIVSLTHIQKASSIELIFKNTSGVAYTTPLSASLPNRELNLPILDIPPFGQQIVSIPTPGFRFLPQSLKLDIKYGTNSVSLPITIPSNLPQTNFLAALVASGIILLALAIIAWRLYLRNRRPRPPVYW